MSSPFPGMDPYLERHWGDVHTRLMVYASSQLNAQLPADLQARVEEGVGVEIDNEPSRTVYPDVRVVEDEGFSSSESAVAAVAVAEPVVVVNPDEPATARHIEIVDVDDGGRVVTAVEVLSPGNKNNRAGRLAYRVKRNEYLEAGVNLVEIDLVRQGKHILAVPEELLSERLAHSCRICVTRAEHFNRWEVYPAPLRELLPNFRIPLRPSDRDVVLQLQPLIDDCYRDGRYDRTDYSRDAAPPLKGDDAQWADALLREAGRR